MALVRVELLEGRSPEHRAAILDAIEAALVESLAVPPGDPTLRVIEHDSANVRRPSSPRPVDERWVLVEVTLFAGRSLQAKRRLYREIVTRLDQLGHPPQAVTIVLLESARENWGVEGGLPASEVELPFEVEV